MPKFPADAPRQRVIKTQVFEGIIFIQYMTKLENLF